MSSLLKPGESATDVPVPGVVRDAEGQYADPFAQLDSLMVVVEQLCPRWPERPSFAGKEGFLL
jgi:hypothetical protein